MKMRLHKRLSRQLRQKVRNRLLSNFGSAILADTWNGQLLVEAGDFHVARRLLRAGEYDRAELEWLLHCFENESPTVVVVGTHVGAVLIPLARVAARVVGFEADATNFRLLCQNLLLNRIDNTTVHNVAVGAADGKAVFARNPLNTGNSHIAAPDSQDGVEVPMVSLDSALAAHPGEIDLLLMDIEGHEPQALAGGALTLSRTRRIYVEFAPEGLRAQGNDPAALLETLAGEFPFLYLMEDGVVRMFSSAEGTSYLLERAGRRGFLRNLLYCRSALRGGASETPGARAAVGKRR